MIENSVFANSQPMDGLAADTKLIKDLCAWSGKAASRIAADLGMAATTLTRPASGKATTRLSRQTLAALRSAFPDFPEFKSAEPIPANATPAQFEGASLEEPFENLPVWGTGLGAATEIDGEAIEQTMLNTGEVIEYVKRPAILKRKDGAYAIYTQGSSMHPALPDGEMAVAVKGMPLSMGDNVVVYLRAQNPEFDDGERAVAVLVKELVRRSAAYVELRQYQPAKDFRIPMADVIRIDRILTRREMLA
jgi:hypothetical protein